LLDSLLQEIKMSFLQEIFNEISLTKNISIWESEEDTITKDRKRLQLLASYPECSFSKILDPNKSPGRKNSTLSAALLKKATASGDLVVYNQALCYAEAGPSMDSVLRARANSFDEDHLDWALDDLHQIQEKTKQDQEIIRKLKKKIKAKTKLGNEVTEPSLIEERHKDLKQFSNSVFLKEKRGAGRFLCANRDIIPGDAIAVETSYVALLDKKYLRDHCDECLTETKYIVPSLCCASVVYCSTACRNQTRHHKMECLLLEQIFKAETEAWHLALRLVATQPLKVWLTNGYKEKTNVHDSLALSTVYGLVTHKGEADRTAPVLMKESLTALFYLRVLKVSGYFQEKSLELELSPEELAIGELILHFMRVVFFNSHEVTERSSIDKKIVKIGVCLNPSLALINHSCDPNYARVVKGRKSIAFATRLIKKGEEIHDVYSPTFFTAGRTTRLDVTERYNFSCCCEACVENWSTQYNMSPKVTFIGQKEDDTQLENSIKLMLKPDWLVDKPIKASIAELSRVLNQSRSRIEHPCKPVLLLEALLHAQLWKLYG